MQLFSKSAWYLADKYNAHVELGLKAKDMPSRKLEVLYQTKNEILSEYMKQIEHAANHIGPYARCVEILLEHVQEQLRLNLRSMTLPFTEENIHLAPRIHDDWRNQMFANIECTALRSSNRTQIVFHNFTLLGDIWDTTKHMFSFSKKQYDLALYYQNKMDKLKKQTGQDLNVRMNINVLQWFMLHNKAYLLFLKVKAWGIDPTDEMMKSALGLVAYRVEYLKQEKIHSIEFFQQIINKTYINYWQNSSVVHGFQQFLNETLPLLASI